MTAGSAITSTPAGKKSAGATLALSVVAMISLIDLRQFAAVRRYCPAVATLRACITQGGWRNWQTRTVQVRVS